MSKSKPPYKPTKLELEGAPRALLYELQMFRFSVQRCMDLELLHNEALETALLHARNLRDFFCDDHSTEDNICAGYFVDESHKKEGWWKSSRISYLLQHRTKINKLLSHLTFSRIKKEKDDKGWNLKVISEEIEKAYAEFYKLLPQEDGTKWPPPENSGTDKP